MDAETLRLLREMNTTRWSGPEALHNAMVRIVTSFLRDDRYAPCLIATHDEDMHALHVDFTPPAIYKLPGNEQAAILAHNVRKMGLQALSLASPTFMFNAGDAQPATPNTLNLTTLGNGTSAFVSRWKIEMRSDGGVLGFAPRNDQLGGIADYWLDVFPSSIRVLIEEAQGGRYCAARFVPVG